MPRASRTVTIRRPASDVFAFLADAENDRRWRPAVLDMRRVSGDGVGTVYAQGLKGPFGRRIPADIEITELNANRAIGFKTLAGPVRPTGRYVLVSKGATTELTFTLEVELGGLKSLMAPMVRGAINGEVANLDRLRKVLESA